MSSIGGSNETSLTLQLFFQNTDQSNQATNPLGSQSQQIAGSQAATAALDPAGAQATSTSSATGSTGLQQQVLAAVQSAVENFNTTDPSGSLQSLLSTIGQTIAQTLQASGITPSQGQHHHHHRGGTGGAGGAGSSGGSSGSSTDASTNVATTTSSNPPTIDQLLTQAGQDPSQVKNALISEIENPGSGDNNVQEILAQLFSGLPTGSAVDVQA